MTVIGNILKAIGLWYAKKHLVGLIIDGVIEAADEVSQKTKTKLDDTAVKALKDDKEEIKAIVNKFL